MQGYLDQVSAEMITGWACDPENLDKKIKINVCVDDAIVWAGLADQFRSDLLAAGVGDGCVAFFAKVQLPFKESGQASLVVRVCAAETGEELTYSPQTVIQDLPDAPVSAVADVSAVAESAHATAVSSKSAPSKVSSAKDKGKSASKKSNSLRLNIEYVGDLEVRGWICEKEHPDKILSAAVLADGNEIDVITANVYRSDLKSAGLGHGNHGFSWRPTAGVRDGKPHVVELKIEDTVVALSRGQGRGVVFSRPIEVVGRVDVANGHVISGWACNKLDAAESIVVNVEIDGRFVAAVAANAPRQDVEQAKAGHLKSGFSWIVPPALRDGRRHMIRCIVAGCPLPLSPDVSSGVLFGLNEDSFFEKAKPREFKHISPANGGIPDYFAVRAVGATTKVLVLALIERKSDWAELDKKFSNGFFSKYNVIAIVRRNSDIASMAADMSGCDRFFLVEYGSKVSSSQAFLHTLGANVILDYESVLLFAPGLDGVEQGDAIFDYNAALLDDDVGILAKGFVAANTVVNESIGTLLRVALPRLGCALADLEFSVPIGSTIYANVMLLRHIHALSLRVSDLENPKLKKEPIDWFLLVRVLLGFFAEQGAYQVTTKILPPSSASPAAPRTVKTIAFLLPQFHPVEENDAWWGKGFTEWNNVIRARPLFRSHYQPRLPKDLGFYDLRHPDTQRRQAKLAQENGVYGFCYYYYWFDGKKILNEPIEQMLNSGSPDYPFCVCWANENWSRNWDGQDRFLLLKQSYTPESNRAIIGEFIKMMRDPRYIRHNGKPVLIVYRIKIIPDWLRVAAMWREECRKAGVGEIHLCAVRFGLESLDGPPSEFGLDAYVLFPPHETRRDDVRSKVLDLNPSFNGEIFAYDGVVDGDLERFKDKDPWYTHRGAMMGWDNTARRLTDSRIFHGATPLKFRKWLKGIVEQEVLNNPGTNMLFFINAWNEWAEGTTLEPDQKFGDSYLRAVRSTFGKYVPVRKALPDRAPQMLPSAKAPAVPAVARATPNVLMQAIKGDVEFKPNRPTIMLCAHVSGHQLFGGERSFLDLVNALYLMDYNVVVCLPSANNKGYVSDIKKKVKFVHVFSYPQWKAKRDIDQFFVLNFSDVIAQHNVTLVYANTIVLLEPLIAAQRMGRARVVHVRELISLDTSIQKQLDMSASEIIADVFQKSDFIIANSMATYHLFSRQGRTFYVPNAVNVRDFPVDNQVGDKIRFGIVSSNIPKKGVADFIEVAALCVGKTDKAEFVVIGPDNKHVEEWKKDPSLPRNLRFLGYRETPVDAMKELNVLLSLSDFAESFGRTVAEAMVSCRPVIAYEWGAVPELIQHGKNGFLVPYRDTAAAAEAVLMLCENPSLIAALGRTGRQNIVNRFSYTALRRGLEDAMDGIFDNFGVADKSYTVANSYMTPAPTLTVIIPVYNAAEEVERCIDSVLRHTNMELIKLLIINDASTEPEIPKLLEKYVGIKNVEVLHNPVNIGYTRNVNGGIKHAGNADVILLNSDTVVTPNWIAGLRAAAFSGDKIGTVTAISDNAGAFSFPEMGKKNPLPENFHPDDFAIRMIQATRNCAPIEVPTGSGFCMYISRRLIEEIGVFDEEAFARGYGEENDFCMRALKAGWKNLITPWCYVYHVRTASFKLEKEKLVQAGIDVVTKRYPDYAALVKKAFSSDAMLRLREEAATVYDTGA